MFQSRRHATFLSMVTICILALTATESQAVRIRGPFLQQPGAESVLICWETPEAATATLLIRDAEGDEFARVAATEAAKRHELQVAGLTAGATYSYSLFVGKAAAAAGVGIIRTAPAKGQPISFAAWGDSRGNEKASAALAGMILKTGVGMNIHTGDIVDDGKALHQWDSQFFNPCAPMLRSVATYTAIGNHDMGAYPDSRDNESIYKQMFALPGVESYYSFDYGDAHFIVLDSEKFGDDQVAFVEKDLQETDARWLFAVTHRPPYSSSHHPSDIAVRTRILPLLARHNVDLIIAGHNHNFMLTKPIRHVYEKDQARPYIQMVTGGGGAYFADFRTEDLWFDRAFTEFHYVLIHIDGDKLTAQAIDAGGRKRETLVLDRSEKPKDEIAFEHIELERYLSGLNITNANFPGWPTGYVVKADSDQGELVYNIRNPMQEPLEVTLTCNVSKGLTFEKAAQTVTLEPQASTSLIFPFKVTSAADLYPVTGPVVNYKTVLGAGNLTPPSPAIALGRELAAARTRKAPDLDGIGGDSAWKKADEEGRFVRWVERDLAWQDPSSSSSLRAVHDDKNLYLLLHRPLANGTGGEPADEEDHFSFYIASPSSAAGFRGDITGKASPSGSKGFGEQVRSACTKDSEGVTWEVAVPLTMFIAEGMKSVPPLVFNLQEKRGKEYYTFSPNFKQFNNRENTARVVLEK